MKLRASIDLFGLDARTVERSGPGAAPTAFRIWRAGQNPTDKGMTLFSAQSAAALMASQAERGNLFSIDVDHLSLSSTAPPEARRAVGWHRLDVRPDENAQPELWAVDVEWTDIARVGLEAQPPEWRYFSPAYDVDDKSREVIAYLNTALTNNPATFNVTALASRAAQERNMGKMEDVLAALKAMADEGDEDEKKQAARMIRAAEGEEPDGDEGKDEEKKDAEEKDAEEEPAKKEPEKDSRASADPVIALAAEVQRLSATVDILSSRDERSRLLTSRHDLAPSVRAWLERAPIATVRDALKALPVAARRDPAAATKVTTTRAQGQGDARSARLSPDEKRALDEGMGMTARKDSIRRERASVVFGVLDRDGARRVLASKKAGA